MKILVCISHVPDTTAKINFTNNDSAFDTNGVQFVINPNDEFGLTRAIWFKEQAGATVTVVNVGGPDAEATLRKPSVADLEELQEEPITAGLFWRNRVTRVLLVVIMVNLTVSMGMFASGYILATRLVH